MQIKKTSLIDCYEITPNIFVDKRGEFVKTFHHDLFKEYQLETQFVEQYYSVSCRGVLRGLHFQIPPKEHVKLVYCPVGEIMDVVVDLRKDSPTYGQFESLDISAEKKNMVYIPKGMAHGFLVKSEIAIVVCSLSTVFSPEHDGGIRWNSLKISWPDLSLILSEKDKELPIFSEFISPFHYARSENDD